LFDNGFEVGYFYGLFHDSKFNFFCSGFIENKPEQKKGIIFVKFGFFFCFPALGELLFAR